MSFPLTQRTLTKMRYRLMYKGVGTEGNVALVLAVETGAQGQVAESK